MSEKTTIQLDKQTLALLKQAKQYERQSYDELIRNMAKTLIETKRKSQYDQFLHEIQKQKMKEIWDNEQDEVWNDA